MKNQLIFDRDGLINISSSRFNHEQHFTQVTKIHQ